MVTSFQPTLYERIFELFAYLVFYSPVIWLLITARFVIRNIFSAKRKRFFLIPNLAFILISGLSLVFGLSFYGIFFNPVLFYPYWSEDDFRYLQFLAFVWSVPSIFLWLSRAHLKFSDSEGEFIWVGFLILTVLYYLLHFTLAPMLPTHRWVILTNSPNGEHEVLVELDGSSDCNHLIWYRKWLGNNQLIGTAGYVDSKYCNSDIYPKEKAMDTVQWSSDSKKLIIKHPEATFTCDIEARDVHFSQTCRRSK